MNFNQLYKKIADLDKPVIAESQIQECGEPMGMSGMTPPGSAPTTPPSMSVNLNAQGMDNIESLLKLMTKVNPDMMPKTDMPMPSMTDPVIKIGGDKPGLEPLKMLPDLDHDDQKPGGDMDIDIKGLDRDGDGDHDMDDHDMEDEPEEEAMDGGFGAATTGPKVVQKDISASVPNGNDMHREKRGYARAQPGDNPRAVGESDLSSKIKNDLYAQYESFKQQ